MSRIDEARRRAASLLRGGPDGSHPYSSNPLEAFPPARDNGRPEPDRSEPRASAKPPLLEQQGGFDSALAGEKLIVDDLGNHVEEYRRLSATLHQIQLERGLKRVMVTSACAGEGKTLTAANLSLTLSESYRRRVLLVDADLRRPSLAALLHAPGGSGLSDWLRTDDRRPPYLVRLSEHLTLLPGGEGDPDPLAILSSPQLGRILEQAASEFDWIVIDTPPVAQLADARLLTSNVEGIVFVIAAASTPFAMIRHALDALDPKKVVGVVLNRVADDVLNQAGYDYYNQYTKPRTAGNRRFPFRRAAAPTGSRSALGLGRESRRGER
jgi:capsular exopolysaccharide synthesis family protein